MEIDKEATEVSKEFHCRSGHCSWDCMPAAIAAIV